MGRIKAQTVHFEPSISILDCQKYYWIKRASGFPFTIGSVTRWFERDWMNRVKPHAHCKMKLVSSVKLELVYLSKLPWPLAQMLSLSYVLSGVDDL
jgi:hypothetical protein